jgi:hypothetical protein
MKSKKALALNDFDLFAELFKLNTKGRQSLDYVTFAKKLGAAIEKTEKTEDFAAVLKPLQSIYKMAEDVPESLLDKAIISELVKSVGTALGANGEVYIENYVSIVIMLRWISDFSEADPNMNLRKAVVELYGPSGEIPFKSRVLTILVQNLFYNTKDTLWVKDTFSKIVQIYNEGPLSPDLVEMTNYLFYQINSGFLAENLNHELRNAKKSSPILDQLIITLAPELSEINHSDLKAYYDLLGKDKKAFLDSLYKKRCKNFLGVIYPIDKIFREIADYDFDLFVDLLNINTKDRQLEIPLRTYVDALSKYKPSQKWAKDTGIKSSLISVCEIIIKKIANKELKDNNDKEAVSRLILNDIEPMIATWYNSGLIGEITKLRLKIEFTGPKRDNVVKAIRETLALDSSNKNRGVLNKKLIREVLIKDTPPNTAKLIKVVFNEIVQDAKSKGSLDDDNIDFAMKLIIDQADFSLVNVLDTMETLKSYSRLSMGQVTKICDMVIAKLPTRYLGFKRTQLAFDEKKLLTKFLSDLRANNQVDLDQIKKIEKYL